MWDGSVNVFGGSLGTLDCAVVGVVVVGLRGVVVADAVVGGYTVVGDGVEVMAVRLRPWQVCSRSGTVRSRSGDVRSACWTVRLVMWGTAG